MKSAIKTQIGLGRNVARLRNDLKLTQESFAEAAEIHWRYLQKIEAGAVNPSFMILCRLRKALDCSWDELFQDIR